jgi:hypothetical protein
MIGVHTSSFQGLLAPGRDPVDVLVRALAACGARECELFAPQVEAQFGGPHAGHGGMSSMSPQMMRRELRKWRLRTPPRYFEAIGARFREAGVAIRAWNYSPDGSFSDPEIDRGFEMAKALGAAVLTASADHGMAKRIAPLAAQHRMTVAFAGGGALDAIGVSPYFRIVVDAVQAAPANTNLADYVRAHRGDIAVVRVTCGQADAQARQVLDALAHGSGPIGVFVDLRGSESPIDDVKRCLAALRSSA